MGSFDIWWEGGCWEWDVAAGIAILQEAGGLITTANPPKHHVTASIEDVKLGSRLYLAIRPAGPSSIESGRQGQERTVREVWRRVRNLDYSRPAKPQLLLSFRHCISFVLFVSHTILFIKQTLNKWSIPDAHSLDL